MGTMLQLPPSTDAQMGKSGMQLMQMMQFVQHMTPELLDQLRLQRIPRESDHDSVGARPAQNALLDREARPSSPSAKSPAMGDLRALSIPPRACLEVGAKAADVPASMEEAQTELDEMERMHNALLNKAKRPGGGEKATDSNGGGKKATAKKAGSKSGGTKAKTTVGKEKVGSKGGGTKAKATVGKKKVGRKGGGKRPSVPNTSAGPCNVRWRGGKILSSVSKNGWRVYQDEDSVKEKCFSYSYGMKQSWDKALDFIEGH